MVGYFTSRVGIYRLSRYGSFLCSYLPGISALSEGTRTILLTVAISGAAAVLFPVRQEENEDDA